MGGQGFSVGSGHFRQMSVVASRILLWSNRSWGTKETEAVPGGESCQDGESCPENLLHLRPFAARERLSFLPERFAGCKTEGV